MLASECFSGAGKEGGAATRFLSLLEVFSPDPFQKGLVQKDRFPLAAAIDRLVPWKRSFSPVNTARKNGAQKTIRRVVAIIPLKTSALRLRDPGQRNGAYGEDRDKVDKHDGRNANQVGLTGSALLLKGHGGPFVPEIVRQGAFREFSIIAMAVPVLVPAAGLPCREAALYRL